MKRRDRIEDLLQGAGLYARRRYRRVFAAMALLVLIAIFGVSRIRFDTEVLNLLPQDDPQVKTFREVLAEFGSPLHDSLAGDAVRPVSATTVDEVRAELAKETAGP